MISKHIDYDFLSEIAETVEDEFQGIIKTFIEFSGKILESLPAKASESNIDPLVLSIHSLKGSCRNIGAEKLAELCMDVEALAKKESWSEIDFVVGKINAEFELVKASLLTYCSQL